MPPDKSRDTIIAERMKDRLNGLAAKIREQNPQPFGVTQLSPAEFRKRAETDEAFRVTMSQQMGPRNFLKAMNGDQDGNQPSNIERR